MQVQYKTILLSMLVVVGVASNFERFIFSLVLEPIKSELLLSDSQLGLMTGIAFFAFYALAGVPIARWADNGDRSVITAGAVAICGLMISMCGMVTGFIQLLIVRAGVAVGEAAVVPAGQSLISDYFDRKERPRAMSIYISFYTISMILGYLLGGWLVEQYGWRKTFIIIGAPNLIIALIAKFLIKESRVKVKIRTNELSPPVMETFKQLWKQNTFRQILILFCLGYFFNAGIGQWLPTFLIRSYDMNMTEVGLWLALSFGLCGTLGILVGGYLASRFAANQERRQMQCLAIVVIGYGVTSAIAYLSANKDITLIFIALSAFLMMLNNGPIFAAIQSLVQERVRSVAVAITFMFGNLVGLGLGPLSLGVISDLLMPIVAEESLRYALLAFCPGTLLMAFYYWKASCSIEEDIKDIELKSDYRPADEFSVGCSAEST